MKKSRQVSESTLLAAVSMLPLALQNLLDQSLGIRTCLAVLPLATISDAVDLIVESDGAALGNVVVGAPLDALLEEINALGAVILANALVQSTEIDAVLKSTVLNQILGWNLGVVARQTHGETEGNLGVSVEVGGTEFDNVSKTLGLTVHALNTIIMVGSTGEVLGLVTDMRLDC